MDEESIEAMIDGEPGEGAADGEDRLRTPVTILFSDIKGSTAYFEQKGDIEGLAMIERHNKLLLPCIENNNGRLIKTIGDALMTLFSEPVDALRAAVGMQNALFVDGQGRAESEQIQIRIGIHHGLGLIRDNDVFGDVVNAAARVQSKALPDQILITESLVPAAETAGYQIGKLGRTRLEGKEEPIDVFTMGWSPASTQRLIDDLQTRFDDQLRDMKQARVTLDEAFDAARAEWRAERRKLHAEIERLEDGIRDAAAAAREQITEEFRQELRFRLEESDKARGQAERDLQGAHERFETERDGYRAQIESLEKRLVEALERVNNPARVAAGIQGQIDERLAKARQQWEAQWASEREQLHAEIVRIRNTGSRDAVAEARRQVQERLKARQALGDSPAETSDLVALKSERDTLEKRVLALEAEAEGLQGVTRREVSREVRHLFEQRLGQSGRVQTQLEQELQALRKAYAAEKESLTARIAQLEESIPRAQEATRLQTLAEIEADFRAKLDESERGRASIERRQRDEAEEWELERRQLIERLEALETRLEEARDMAFKRSGDPSVRDLNELRRQLEGESQDRRAGWEEEKRRLLERIELLEDSD